MQKSGSNGDGKFSLPTLDGRSRNKKTTVLSDSLHLNLPVLWPAVVYHTQFNELTSQVSLEACVNTLEQLLQHVNQGLC